MSSGTSKSNKMSRRGFVAGAAVAGVAAGAMGSAAWAEGAGDAADTAAWDASYDVVVVGYGAAGATAARFAADAGARVLICEVAPEGGEGGNSKFAKQLLASGEDFSFTRSYLDFLNDGFAVDPEVLDVFAQGLADIPAYCNEYLGAEVHSWRGNSDPVLGSMVPEYPDAPDAEKFDAFTISEGCGDGALWFRVRELVEERADSIDVWYASPALHLVTDPADGGIAGVVVEHEGAQLRVQAASGVVLACGGFENNQGMIQDYLGVTRLEHLGTPYNNGDGIRMALEVGADLWHMMSYEPGTHYLMLDGGLGTGAVGGGGMVVPMMSAFYAGNDGRRYCNELAEDRHGRVEQGGEFRPMMHPTRPWVVFDQTRMDELVAEGTAQLPAFQGDQLKCADTLEGLAEACGMDPAVLVAQVEDFNFFAETGKDYQYGRVAQAIRAFDAGPYYAMPGVATVLNTQGGPRRNAKAQVVGADGEPIARLYSAGELGSVNAFQYQGGCNLSECLIFGKIAGEGAAGK